MTDINVEIAQLQQQIGDHLGLDAANIIYDYDEQDGRVKLDVVTVNPRHAQSFLFHTVEGYSKVDALRSMLEYVRNYKEKLQSYTIQWSIKDDAELHTSYFHAPNIMSALDKFYFGRDPQSITVFSVVLNPIS